ncbi:MAG: hypothetical protein NC215_00215 [Ruminococcus sp.]|nr:hypothetical protein [Ruminococcus sp.]
MAKFYGAVGYAESVETSPGIWTDRVTERMYYGDLIKHNRRLQTSENLNDNINISNDISILADPYAVDNFHLIKYVNFMGTNWKVTNVEVQFPRLILTLGGIYNGETT